MSNTKLKIILNEDEIPPGAVQIHLYNWRNVLMPRGPMKKESLHEYILEKLLSYFESWVDPKYGDNPDVLDLANQLHANMLTQADSAWNSFIHHPKVVPILAKAVEEKRKEQLCEEQSDTD
jgi:hypothetical protein